MPLKPPDRADLRKCRKCQADIFFAESAKQHRPVPMDAIPVKGYRLTWKPNRRDTANGGQYVCDLIDVFTTHFVTCPEAASFRKTK